MSRRQPRPNSHVNSSSRKIVQKAARNAAPASASNRQSNQVVATMARGAIAACTKSHDRAPTLSEMAALAAAFETNPSVRAAAQKDDGKKRRKAHKKRKAKILKEMQDRQHHHQQRYSMVNTYLLARVSLMAAKTRNHLMSLQTVNVASKSKRRSQRRLLATTLYAKDVPGSNVREIELGRVLAKVRHGLWQRFGRWKRLPLRARRISPPQIFWLRATTTGTCGERKRMMQRPRRTRNKDEANASVPTAVVEFQAAQLAIMVIN